MLDEFNTWEPSEYMDVEVFAGNIHVHDGGLSVRDFHNILVYARMSKIDCERFVIAEKGKHAFLRVVVSRDSFVDLRRLINYEVDYIRGKRGFIQTCTETRIWDDAPVKVLRGKFIAGQAPAIRGSDLHQGDIVTYRAHDLERTGAWLVHKSTFAGLATETTPVNKTEFILLRNVDGLDKLSVDYTTEAFTLSDAFRISIPRDDGSSGKQLDK